MEPICAISIMRLPWTFLRGVAMAAGDPYRIRAASFQARALCAPSMRLRVQYESLSEAYLRLAEQADRNDMTDIALEPPPPKIDNPDRQQ